MRAAVRGPQKETPACGGRRAGDAISGGVRTNSLRCSVAIVNALVHASRETQWIV